MCQCIYSCEISDVGIKVDRVDVFFNTKKKTIMDLNNNILIVFFIGVEIIKENVEVVCVTIVIFHDRFMLLHNFL